MGKRIRRNQEWCPECGHLLPKKKWECQFCGWSINEFTDDTLIEDIPDSKLEKHLADIDQFIDKLDVDHLDTSI